MYKIALIVSCLFFLNLYLKAQDSIVKNNFIHEVDSLFKHVKDLKNEQAILYYPDGAVKYGIILWRKENMSNGLAFKKTKNNFLVKKINKKNISQSKLFSQFADSLDIFKKYVPASTYNISHDFNVVWVYSANMRTDTIIRPMSEIIGGSDRFGRSAFLKFEKLFDLSKPSNSSPSRRKLRK